MTAFAHSNPVTQAGFTIIPNVVLLDPDLSLGAKVVYGYLKHLAWRNGDKEVEPPRAVVSRDLAISERALNDYLRELRAAGLVESKRRGLGLPNAYLIHDPDGRQITPDGSADFAVPDGANPPIFARARSSSLNIREQPKTDLVAADATTPDDGPPKLAKVDGRDVAFDALAAACGVEAGSNRERDVAIALNGSPKKGLTRGIRALAWHEVVAHHFAGDESSAREVVDGEPERFERAVAALVGRRAEQYRRAMPRVTLTPLALAKWWLDLERPAASDGMTADEMATYGAGQ